MAPPVDALMTGFCRAPQITAQALAPLRRLRQAGYLRAVHYVTWDSPELDTFVAPVAAMPDVHVTRVPQPAAQGTGNQRGVVYQVENLRAGLALLPGDGLVLKTRPDVVARADLLRDKITRFQTLCAPVDRIAPGGVAMPAPVFTGKMWLPWADAGQFFFFEDAMFLATAADAARMVTALDAGDMALLGDAACGSYAHAVRYARIFLNAWPIFAGYLKNYRGFRNDMDYRRKLVPMIMDDGFFWHLIVAHAWILFSHFHIDAGGPGDIRFHANNVNKESDWSRPETLRNANPYDDVANWRMGTRPGSALPCVSRLYARLVDDAWQNALFTQALPDLPPGMLRALMENAAARDGRLAELEAGFYRKLEALRGEPVSTAPPTAKAG